MTRLNLRRPVVFSITALLLAVLTLGAAPARAQSTSSGAITGTVTDATGAVIPGVTIVAKDKEGK